MSPGARLHSRSSRTALARGAAVLAVALLALSVTRVSAQAEPVWTTYHRDAARSGYDPDGASPLTPTLAWQSPALGAPIWGQPLVLGSRMYVATVGNDLYALDTATGAFLWAKNAGPPVPSEKLPCGDIQPTVGIVGTPVIDPATSTIYAVADVWDQTHGAAHHELVGYNLANGGQVLRTPVDPPGSEPKDYLQRPGLNLDGGNVVLGMGGNDGDCGTYRGTVASVPEGGGAASFWQVPIKVKTNSGGAVWGTSGPAVDGEGHIIASTGNPNPSGEKATVYDYSDSLVELSPALSLMGWFKPPSWEQDSNSDTDLGSAGPQLLPGALAFQAGKNGTGYLVSETTMGSGAGAVFSGQVCGGAGSFGGDAYVSGVIYVACSNGVQALAYNQAARTFAPIWKGPSDAAGAPIVSAGLVWVVATHGSTPGKKLYGLDPTTGVPRYTETLPTAAIDHFASPSAAGGRLFVATGSTVSAYQIAVPPPESASGPSVLGPLPGPGSTHKAASMATLVGTTLTVSRSGWFKVKVRCPSGVHVCRGTIILRTLRAVIAGTVSNRRPGKAHAAVLSLASGTFKIPGGHVSAVKLRMGPKARRFLLRKRVVHARATLTTRGVTGRPQSSRAAVTLRLVRRH